MTRHDLRQAARTTLDMDWSKQSARTSLRCLPGISLALLAGLLAGSPAAGAVASGGALAVGFGSFQCVRGSRTLPMLLAIAGITMSGFVGSLAGHSALGFTLIAGLLAYGVGLLTAFGTGAWWIGLQCLLFALIASSYPVGLGPTLQRVALVLAGAVLQLALILLFFRLERRNAPEAAPCPGETAMRSTVASGLRVLRQNMSLQTDIGREALRLGLTVTVAALLSRIHWLGTTTVAGQIGGYWMPLTAAVVLKNDLHQTFRTGLGRLAGTLAGSLLATLLIALLQPGPATLAALGVLLAWLCYSLLRVNYAVFALCMTSFLVFQLSLVGLPVLAVVEARTLHTVLGGTLALLAHLLWAGPSKETLDEQQPETG